jgi:hypothetical protein
LIDPALEQHVDRETNGNARHAGDRRAGFVGLGTVQNGEASDDAREQQRTMRQIEKLGEARFREVDRRQNIEA